MKSSRTKNNVTAGMICAMAYVLVLFINIPIIPSVDFLKYEPKDIVITIGGFILGPWAAVASSVTVSLIEMVTISTTGIIGLIMNILSSCAFALPAAIIYKKHRRLPGAVIGLVSGSVLMTAVMLLWNYLIAPLYMGVGREVIISMLTTVFLPFNLLKGAINSALIILVYKPLVTVLRKTGLIETKSISSKQNGISAFLIGIFVLISGILVILAINGII